MVANLTRPCPRLALPGSGDYSASGRPDWKNLLIVCCMGLLLWEVSFAASAQEVLPDPTRQPLEVGAIAVSASAVPDNATREIHLQSIIISHEQRAAIIDGQLFKLGDSIGEAKLLQINEGSIVLSGTQGRKTVNLFPGVEIKRKEILLPAESNLSPVKKNKAGEKKLRTKKANSQTAQPEKKEENKR